MFMDDNPCMLGQYKKAHRKVHPEDTIVTAGLFSAGGGGFALIAGPCAVETKEGLLDVARKVKAAGATMLRGGAFKPRSSPYAFQGLGKEGLKILLDVKAETGLPVVTEILDIRDIPLFEQVDVLQVGAHNMQNTALLKELGKLKKPVLLKRGSANTLEELLLSAEYILSEGNDRVILCERGIRTFEHVTRYTLDLSAVPMLKLLSHLPVFVDPSHAAGMASLIRPMSLAAAAAGADGLMIEVHNDPGHALCDGSQAITPEEFTELTRALGAVTAALRHKEQ